MYESSLLSALIYAYYGQLVAASICQLLLLRSDNRKQIFLWILASVITAVSVSNAPHVLTVFTSEDLKLWGATLSLVGGLVRFASLSLEANRFGRNRLANVLALVSIAATPLAFSNFLLDYRALVSSIIGMTISLACFFAVKHNRFWATQNEFGRNLVLLGMAVSVVMMAIRGSAVYPFGEDRFFAGTSATQLFGMAALVTISLLLQIGFTGMLVSRQATIDRFSDRRAVRAQQQSIAIAESAQAIKATAEQRLEFIQLLAHEVRQPINNAQAALQSITAELDPAELLTASADRALDRAMSSLDSITLALSNVILIGTLSTPDQRWVRQATNAIEMWEMARLDCPSCHRKRIVILEPSDNIFVECVPIFVRVALHNLLEHAVSLSETESDITVSLETDEARLGIVFSITSRMSPQMAHAAIPYEEIHMTDTSPSQLTDLGVYVADLVATHHAGDLVIETNKENDLNIKFVIR